MTHPAFSKISFNAIPLYDPVSHLVYSASGKDVSTVMIDGEILYQDNTLTTIDIEKITKEVKKYQEKWID